MNLEIPVENVKNMSFIRARDPSILAMNIPTLNPNIKVALHNKLSEVTSSDIFEEDNSKESTEHIKVYLRIKPIEIQQGVYKIKDEQTLYCKMPDGSQALRNLKEGHKIYRKFSFSKIYGPETTQEEIFNDCVKDKVLGFINGRNSTLFTYGCSGSGKTFTILGEPENPGIIPRALEYIFRTLPQIEDVPVIKPASSGGIDVLNKNMSKQELLVKKTILNSSTCYSDKSIHIKTYRAMQRRLSKEIVATLLDDFSHITSNVWVSFAEVYNEYVYDLLQPEQIRGRSRTKLPLGLDENGQTYIKNLSSIFVSSGIEAYEILQYGMHNLNYASTAVNQHSSRSHCIFTIKLAQGNQTDGSVQISHFNFCDLAGSERIKNSCSVGERLKESTNINTSLHVLGKCIKSIRESQKNNDSRRIPYRESKLTRLFQPALSGQESIAMIVNMNPEKNMFDESQHVLNFSAIAKDVTVELMPNPKKPMKLNRFSLYIETKKGMSSTLRSLPSIEEGNSSEIQDLQDQVMQLTQALEMERNSAFEKELAVRRELTSQFHKHVDEITKKWESRLMIEKKKAKENFDHKYKEMSIYYQELISQASTRNPQNSDLIDLTSEEELNQDSEFTKLQLELQFRTEELELMTEKYKETKRKEVELYEIISDAEIEYKKLEKEKRQCERQLEDQIIELYNLQGEVKELNKQLSAQNVDQMEKVEYVEELEEKLNRTLAELDDSREHYSDDNNDEGLDDVDSNTNLSSD